jgi:hypothetical protein
MGDVIKCELCGRRLPVHHSYVVRIDVFADPSVPAVTLEDVESADFEAALDAAMQQMQGMSADELQDQVHRRFEYRICAACQARFLANPLGKPRKTIETQVVSN